VRRAKTSLLDPTDARVQSRRLASQRPEKETRAIRLRAYRDGGLVMVGALILGVGLAMQSWPMRIGGAAVVALGVASMIDFIRSRLRRFR
jgi:hypothetical protein